MEKRRDKCKCGKFIVWDEENKVDVVCIHCKTVYTIETDYMRVRWLEEKIKIQRPYCTEAR